MAGKARFTRTMVKKAILGDSDVQVRGADNKLYPQPSSRGIKSLVCARLGCSRQTLDNYLKKYPDLMELLTDEGESLIDLAESQLAAAINKGDMRAILFTLETKGKGRGWSKRTEVTGANGVPLGLPPDVLEMMQNMGISVEDVMTQIAVMVREGAGAAANG